MRERRGEREQSRAELNARLPVLSERDKLKASARWRDNLSLSLSGEFARPQLCMRARGYDGHATARVNESSQRSLRPLPQDPRCARMLPAASENASSFAGRSLRALALQLASCSLCTRTRTSAPQHLPSVRARTCPSNASSPQRSFPVLPEN